MARNEHKVVPRQSSEQIEEQIIGLLFTQTILILNVYAFSTKTFYTGWFLKQNYDVCLFLIFKLYLYIYFEGKR